MDIVGFFCPVHQWHKHILIPGQYHFYIRIAAPYLVRKAFGNGEGEVLLVGLLVFGDTARVIASVPRIDYYGSEFQCLVLCCCFR